MMTGVVERLGIKMMYTTEDDETRQQAAERYKKQFGEYVPNEHFYEITKNQFEHWVKIYNTPGSGCKVIIPINGMRWDAMCSRPSKVIMMWRDPAEIRQSQEAFYKQARATYTGPDDMEPWEYAEAHLRTMLAGSEVMLQNRKKRYLDYVNRTLNEDGKLVEPDEIKSFDFMVVKYRDVLEDPKSKIEEIIGFLGTDHDLLENGIAGVDSSKIRFKKEELAVGI
jgi:hypothetical protein